jgi:hypothetical protein
VLVDDPERVRTLGRSGAMISSAVADPEHFIECADALLSHMDVLADDQLRLNRDLPEVEEVFLLTSRYGHMTLSPRSTEQTAREVGKRLLVLDRLLGPMDKVTRSGTPIESFDDLEPSDEELTARVHGLLRSIEGIPRFRAVD